MLDRQKDVIFFRDADRGQDIVRLMRMHFQRDLFAENRDHGLTLHVKSRTLENIVAGSVFLRKILLGFAEHVADIVSCCHAGRIALVPVAALRILTESALHGDRILNDHIVDAFTDRLDSDPGPADRIRAALSCRYRRHAGKRRHTDRRIQRIETVDRAQLRGAHIVILVIVSAFKTDSVTVQSQMAMCFYKTGIYVLTGGIDDFAFLRQICPDLHDLAVPDQDIRYIWLFMDRVMDSSVLDQHFR